MYCKIHKVYKSKGRSFSIDIETCFKLHSINILYGPSGAGKTSFLRLLSGLDNIDKGSVKVLNNYWSNTSSRVSTPSEQRNIAYVFQDYALFPNMTVLENINFSKKNINKSLLNKVISIFEIDSLLNTKPYQLSGGQQQRIALARAIVQEPEFLFLDEPFTAIDESLKFKIQNFLILLQQEMKFTVIMISHNLQEVIKLANQVHILKNGKVVEQGNIDILLSKNHKNTLKASVLSITEKKANVIIGHQQVIISKEKIVQQNYDIGHEIDIIV